MYECERDDHYARTVCVGVYVCMYAYTYACMYECERDDHHARTVCVCMYVCMYAYMYECEEMVTTPEQNAHMYVCVCELTVLAHVALLPTLAPGT